MSKQLNQNIDKFKSFALLFIFLISLGMNIENKSEAYNNKSWKWNSIDYEYINENSDIDKNLTIFSEEIKTNISSKLYADTYVISRPNILLFKIVLENIYKFEIKENKLFVLFKTKYIKGKSSFLLVD